MNEQETIRALLDKMRANLTLMEEMVARARGQRMTIDANVDPKAMAGEMMAEVKANAAASLALIDATLEGPSYMFSEVEMEAFDCGVVAGCTETMRMLMHIGLLPGGES